MCTTTIQLDCPACGEQVEVCDVQMYAEPYEPMTRDYPGCAGGIYLDDTIENVTCDCGHVFTPDAKEVEKLAVAAAAAAD